MSAPNLEINLFNAYTSKGLLLIIGNINNILTINDYLTLDLLHVTKLVGHYSSMGKESAKEFNAFSQNIQEVTTHLQIHDFFIQKLEHIYTMHKGIIQDIYELKSVDEIISTNYLAIILEILWINKEQLSAIKEQYIHAVHLIQGEQEHSKIKNNDDLNHDQVEIF